MMEVRRQDYSCLFRAEYYRNIGYNLEKLSLVRFPLKMFYVTRKIRTAEERSQDQSCLFRRGDYRNKSRNLEKLSWVRVLVKMLGLGIIVSYDIKRCVPNDQACGKLSGNKYW
jgi:hypothetical protein